jgi:hypothetical protein
MAGAARTAGRAAGRAAGFAAAFGAAFFCGCCAAAVSIIGAAIREAPRSSAVARPVAERNMWSLLRWIRNFQPGRWFFVRAPHRSLRGFNVTFARGPFIAGSEWPPPQRKIDPRGDTGA